jgi:hypothetical protein
MQNTDRSINIKKDLTTIIEKNLVPSEEDPVAITKKDIENLVSYLKIIHNTFKTGTKENISQLFQKLPEQMIFSRFHDTMLDTARSIRNNGYSNIL